MTLNELRALFNTVEDITIGFVSSSGLIIVCYRIFLSDMRKIRREHQDYKRQLQIADATVAPKENHEPARID